MKGSIYMVFDYMDHDLTGLMEREGHNFTIPQVHHLHLLPVCHPSSTSSTHAPDVQHKPQLLPLLVFLVNLKFNGLKTCLVHMLLQCLPPLWLHDLKYFVLHVKFA